MPLAPTIITRPGPLAVPFTYTLGVTEQLRAVSAFAHWDGTSASGTFLPCLSFYAPDGSLFMRVFPATSITAGGTADVTYAPFPSAVANTSGGGGGGGGVRVVRLAVDTPDPNGNAFANIKIGTGWANLRRVLPAFINGQLGTWEGSLQVPDDYASGGTIRLRWAANATTGNLRNRVGTSVIADNVSTDTAYTQESYASTACPGTALQRFTSTFTLSTTLVAGRTLFFQVTRDGGNAADTLATQANLIGADLVYTSSY